MTDETAALKDEDPIQFSFATYGELKQVFGPARAAAMIRTREKKLAQGGGRTPVSRADVDTALRFLRGEKTGAQSSRALKVFRQYFATNEKARRTCENYLEGLREGIQPSSDATEA